MHIVDFSIVTISWLLELDLVSECIDKYAELIICVRLWRLVRIYGAAHENVEHFTESAEEMEKLEETLHELRASQAG